MNPESRGVDEYLTDFERGVLSRHSVQFSRSGAIFGRKLDERELRLVWRVISALRRRSPKGEDWVEWLVGDWMVHLADLIGEQRDGEQVALAIISEEEQLQAYKQHLLCLAGATLLSMQKVEHALKACCGGLGIAGLDLEKLLSGDPVVSKRTLGYLNVELAKRKIFVEAFEQRMSEFVKNRNRFAHQLLLECVAATGSKEEMDRMKACESFMKALLLEANQLVPVFHGLYGVLGLSLEEVRNDTAMLDRVWEEWGSAISIFEQFRRKD